MFNTVDATHYGITADPLRSGSCEPLSSTTVTHYRDRAGRLHEVRVQQLSTEVEWRVVDHYDGHDALLELLRDPSFGPNLDDQARALAVDYGRQVARYLEGLRPDHPLRLADPRRDRRSRSGPEASERVRLGAGRVVRVEPALA